MKQYKEILLEEGDILLIFDAASRYSQYAQVFSKEQAAWLPKYSPWDHQILLKDLDAKISARGHAVYKTIWEEKEALRAHLEETLLVGKVCRSRSKTSSPILFIHKANGILH